MAFVITPHQASSHRRFKVSVKTWWMCELLSMKGFFLQGREMVKTNVREISNIGYSNLYFFTVHVNDIHI